MEASERTYLESLSKEELMALASRQGDDLKSKDGKIAELNGEVSNLGGKIAELEAYILKLRFQLYGHKCERNLPSDPNAVQLTLDLFTDEENAEAQERLKKIEEDEAKKLFIRSDRRRKYALKGSSSRKTMKGKRWSSPRGRMRSSSLAASRTSPPPRSLPLSSTASRWTSIFWPSSAPTARARH